MCSLSTMKCFGNFLLPWISPVGLSAGCPDYLINEASWGYVTGKIWEEIIYR